MSFLPCAGGESAGVISVVVVMFQSAATIAQCVDSVPPDAELILVEQNSGDQAVDVALGRRPNARIIHAETNRGFGAGCNLGAAIATGDVVIFLNPDARFLPGAADRLAATTRRPTVGVAGPTILDVSGDNITFCRRWGTPARDVLNLLVPQPLVPERLRPDIAMSSNLYRVGGDVPYLQGACMAIRRQIFEAVGGFDEAFFLYSEEELLAFRLRSHGYASRLEPGARIVHVGHASTSPTGLFAVRQRFRSRGLYYSRRYGSSRGAVASICLAFGVGLLYITLPLRSLAGFRREATADWCRAALLGLLHGLAGTPALAPDDG